MPAPVENIAYMDAVELNLTTQQLKAAAAATMKETASVESSKKTTTAKPQILDSQANYFANKNTKPTKIQHANMPAPVENIAYMDAVELKPTTQQLKAAAAATMKETASVESTKKSTTAKPQILDSQANYFANKFI
ncbi:hypothetical protein HDU77_004538 [Chytriomyces hyalinus]|nr:hypothetical protein HDU77_004538 [Chytriomyces hyalinus]